MRTTKTHGKRAPIDQRRVSSERSAPKARFTRSQRSASLPASLPSNGSKRLAKPLLIFAGAALLVSLGVALVIAVGAYIRSEQGFSEIEWRAGYYGRPTQPFATLAPGVGLLPADTAPSLGQAASFPVLAAPDDPRWVRGRATPLDGSFQLHAIPALTDDEALQTVSETVALMFIKQVDWGIWAQVRLGEIIGWVDTSTVRLEAL